MKLFIINGENNDEKVEIDINEYLFVKEVIDKLDELLHGNGNFTKYCYRLIYKNIILLDNMIKNYKICENDEIWFGKIENYLRKDDVIVHVFFWKLFFGSDEMLIVKMNDTISKIRSIIERIHCKIINIWNAVGKQMENDQIVTEIDTNENYKLIIKCDDGEGNTINNTFDQCCYLHDRDLIDRYLFVDKIRDDNKNVSTRIILISRMIRIKQIILSNNTIDDRLNQNLSDFPSSYMNSLRLLCNDMSSRILGICYDYWTFVEKLYNDDVLIVYYQYFQIAVQTALWNFSNIRQQNNKEANKSMNDIVIDALGYFVKYLVDASKDWRYWLKSFMNYSLLRSFDDSDLNERINKCEVNKFTIKMRMKGKDMNNFSTTNPKTILEAKQSISAAHKVDMKHLYCIKPGGDHKPNDEDKFDDEIIIEIVLSMDDIEIMRSLGRGGFGEIHLCRDKISNNRFVLKKSIENHGDLDRDINIYSKCNSINIMNYSGLFRNGENICIGMEYVSGGSLRSYLDKGEYLSELEVVKISYEILVQIYVLHKIGIIHRDIKFDNIVLDEHKHPKLIDFGISKYKIGLTDKDLSDKLEAYKPGTIYYMAPELIKGEPYSEKIDIWSFGMVMVELVTHKIPFYGLTPPQAVLRIRNCRKYEFEPIFPISNDFNRFINSCLNTNPDERPSAEQLMKINEIQIINYK